MLDVTDAATSHLNEMLSKAKEETNVPEGTALRLQGSPEGGLSLMLDQEKSGDHKADYADATVLLWDEAIGEALSEQTLDVVETEKGPALSLK